MVAKDVVPVQHCSVTVVLELSKPLSTAAATRLNALHAQHCGNTQSQPLFAMRINMGYLVFEDPVHIFRAALPFRDDCHELVLSKASIDKGIHKRGSQVLPR